MLREVFKIEGLEIDGVIAEWDALIPGLQAGRWQVIGASMNVNEERCQAVAFGRPEQRFHDAFVIDKNNPKVANVRSYAAIAESPDVKIGIAQGSSQEAYIEGAGIPEDQVVSLGGDAQTLFAGLQAGRYDILPGFDTTSPWVLENTVRDPNLVVVALDEAPKLPDGSRAEVVYTSSVFRKDDEDLISFYDKGMAKLRAKRQAAGDPREVRRPGEGAAAEGPYRQRAL
jgi:polar amino acid transport system substrate-binding protein